MARANDPPSIEASRTVTGIFFVAIIDFILLALTILWLVFVCGQGMLPAGAITTLTLLHGVHLIIIVSACIVFPLDVLYIPFWFILAALAVATIDVFVLVSRASALFGGNIFTFGCSLFMFLFDLIFLLFSIMYLAFAARSTSWYGSLGDTAIAEDPFIGKEPPAVAEEERFVPVERRSEDGGAVFSASALLPLKQPPAVSPATAPATMSMSVAAAAAAHKKDDGENVPLLTGSDMFGLPTSSQQSVTAPSASASATQRRQKLKQLASGSKR